MSRKKIGLALSGGGARGFAHVGVLKVLAANDIHFDMIAGTSAGSIVGGALASGMTASEIETMARKVGYLNVMRPSLTFSGLLSSAPMGKLLERELPVSKFEELSVPFAAIAYDIIRGEEVVFKDRGDLVTAIRASCAVPGVFAPIRDGEGRQLVDGGITSVLPADVLRSMGAEVVIAVDVLACGSASTAVAKTSAGIMIRSAMALIRSASSDQRRRCDVIIEPAIAHIRPDQIRRGDELIRLGEQAAYEKLDEIRTVTGLGDLH